MASREEVFTAKILINDQEAESKLKKLETQLEAVKKRRDEALRDGKIDVWKAANKEVDRLSKSIDKQKTLVKGLSDTLDHLSTAKEKELEQVIKAINRQLNSGAVGRNSKEWNHLNSVLKDTKHELQVIRSEGQKQPSVWSKFFKFLNDSWGGVIIIFETITGLSQTVRKSVQDYADMEEAMADTRKYTGLSDEAIRDLNEDLKKIDTRTGREELNELAGAAGRLGKTSKKDILDFVEAGNMIKVALGDDLGEGAIDKVGKLAMAFGEDDRMGLRGAMLATGSAVNELAQNSSAQAGYLVDFTARVAGFGKQLGLTQAQIMGFGAVMDENLLRDEMAATAFGNMLTKMQTDTAKFAKIAGMDIKEFSDLLKKDANAAILRLADSLKQADPQVMMKMLDDMGLDGSRAVGVLATLADKIDDVRQRQQLATKAYAEATSIEKEYNTMNNTVEAGIEKAKKKFQEMSVLLGQKLLPVVKYTISAGSMTAKILYSLTEFVAEHRKGISLLLIDLGVLLVMWKSHSIWLTIIDTKNKLVAASNAALHASMVLLRNAGVALHAMWALLTRGVQGYIVVMRAAKLASLTNPWTALFTVISMVGVAIYGVITAVNSYKDAVRRADPAFRAAQAHAKDMADLNKKVSEAVGSEIGTIHRLTNIIRSNSFSIDERRKAIKRLQEIVPEYQASISDEGTLYEENTKKIDDYIKKLLKVAKAQAYTDKLAEIEAEKLEAELKLRRKQYNLKAVDAELQRGERLGDKNPYKKETKKGFVSDNGGEEGYWYEIETNQKRIKKLKERKTQEEAVNEALKEREVLTRREGELLRQMKADGVDILETTEGKTTPTIPTIPTYKSEEEEKKEERERKRRLKEQAEAVKAEYEEEIACEMLAYRQGLTTYTDYMEERHRITQNYYDKLKNVYGEDSVEYKKLLDNREKEESEYIQWKAKNEEQTISLDKLQRDQNIRLQFLQQEVVDTEAMNEALFKSEITYLKQKQNLYKESSKEWVDIEMQIQTKQKDHQFQLERSWMEKLSKYREEAGLKNYQRLQDIELKGVETFYSALVKSGQMTQAEYDAIVEHIKRKYAELQGQQIANNDIQDKASKGLDTAKKNAGAKGTNAGSDAATGIFSITQAISQQEAINEELKRLYGKDYENNREYQEAKRQLEAETMQQIVAGAQAAYSTISSLISAASSYSQACSDLETAKITADYDRQIEAAGNNSKKKEKLEKERDKKIAKAKTDANRKAMAMEMAQAVAQTAMGAISAYSSTMAGAPYPANLVLAPISAGIALAAGALQIATIKKQHEAEAAGYYEGGFTGGRRYHKEAGVVHEGEFVANHQAVNNPQLLPVLNLIDQAQRNNRVGSLRAEDVTNVMGGPAAAVVAPTVNINTDDEALRGAIDGQKEATELLVQKLDEGIETFVVMDGPNGLYRMFKKYENLISKK